MTLFSQSLRGAAVTATSRAQVAPATGNNYLKNETGKECTLVAVEVFPAGTLETGVLGAGGLVEVVNGSIDYTPCKFYTEMPHELTATSGGFEFAEPTITKMNKPFPKDSQLTFYATPYDDQSQSFEVCVWYVDQENAAPEEAEFVDAVSGTALTQATLASDNASLSIPSNKGGTLIWAKAFALKAAAVVVGTDPNYMGGKVAIRSKSEGWKNPCEMITGAPSGLVAGAYFARQTFRPLSQKLADGTTLYFDYQPYNDASQSLYITIGWKRT